MRYAFAGRRIAFLAAALLALVACGDDSPTDPGTDGPASVKVAESTLTLIALGDSALLTATVHDKSGAVIPNAVVTWSSTDSSVVAVRTNGWAVAKANGSATVVAHYGDVSDSVAVTVAQVVASLAAIVDSLTLGQGDTARVEIVAKDANGAAIANPGVTWSSSAATLVGVDEGGLVTAHRAGGRAAITATAGAVSAEIAVRVMDQIVIQRPFTRLFIVNEDGSGLEPLTDAGWTDSEPTWLNRPGFVGDLLT